MVWYDILPISKINDRLFVSGFAAAAELSVHNPHNISAVLNVHQAPDLKQDPAIVYMHVPFDDGEAIPPEQFTQCLSWLKFMYDNGHTILVHCAAGISRSVTIMAAFMHYVKLADFNEALNQIEMARPNATPAPATKVSAKQMLGVFPYGSLAPAQGHEKIMLEIAEQIQERRMRAHPNPECPMRGFLLNETQAPSNQARHTIPCACGKLLTPVEGLQ